MREDVAERVRRWEPNKPVIVTAEYDVTAQRAQAFAGFLKELEAAARRTSGLRHFNYYTRSGSRRPGQAVRYKTYEEWSTADAFLTYWNSPDVQRFQRGVESVQARPSTIELSTGLGGVEPLTQTQKVRPFRTGQTRSWDSRGEVRGKDDTAGDDGRWRAGETYVGAARFLDNHDGTVTDTLTDLIWLRNANLFGEVPWQAGIYGAAQLSTGAAGLSDGSRPGDWRVPNVNEMQSLLNLNQTFGAAVTPDSPFINLEASNYWTSSSVALAPALGWFVALSVGPPVFDLKMNAMRIWPVKGRSSKVLQTGLKGCFNSYGQPVDCRSDGRGQDGALRMGAPWPAVRFTKNSDGTVTDELTGLVWLRNADAFGRLSWDAAIKACDTLEAGRHGLSDESKAGQWRLPNVNELRSLIDYSQFSPAIAKDHPFENVRSSLYWSSTSVPSAPRLARFVFIGVGPSVWDHKSVLMTVWPVRDPR